jgi:hypothetical protein
MVAMAPQTKASFAQSIQQELVAAQPRHAASVKATMGEAWNRIEKALAVDWLEEATYNALTEATRRALGDEEFQAFFRLHTRRVVRSPGFQSAIEMILRLCGVSPHAILKFAPRARESVVRDCGVLTYQMAGERCAHLLLRGFPTSTYRTGTTLLLLSGTWLGLVDLTGAGASVVLTTQEIDLVRGDTRFILRW